MKALFKLAGILIVLSLFSLQTPKAYAQTPPFPYTKLINPNGLALDTASQAADEGPKTAIIKPPCKTLGIILKTTKISGTIAGSLFIQVSNTGVSTDFATIATIALTDATTNYEYKETDKGFLYYRTLIHQSGTSSLSYSGTYYTTAAPLTGK